MAILDFLFGSQQAQQTSTSQVQLPEYLERATESLVATAGDVAKEGYIPYTGPRLAGLSTLEQQAIQVSGGHRHSLQRQPRAHH
jgi:hypothetical protein